MSGNTIKKTGAWLVVHALEQIGVTHTFGIPGLQNTEIYDELNSSEKIQPVLVTHEAGAAFMADAVSRTSSSVGTLVIVPSAGVTHAMSGIGEAWLDGIPMIIITGGVRRDTGKSYQLHQLDQHGLLSSVTKKTWLINKHEEIVPVIYEAYKTATSGEPGPVFIEIPVEIQIFKGEIQDIPVFVPEIRNTDVDMEKIKKAAELLSLSKNPGMFIGWGCRDATENCIKIAEILGCPVSTTLQ
jgi:acetolactate synthase-1/2/3 large subunit